MPHYLTTLSNSDGTGTPARRARWWADDAGAIDAAYRWLRLHRRVQGELRPRFDRYAVARYDHWGALTPIISGGIDDVPATLRPGTGATVDTTPPPGSRLEVNTRLT